MKKRVRRTKSRDDSAEPSGKKARREESPEQEKEEFVYEEPPPELKTANDITRKWLVGKLNIDAVSGLVMVSMLNLPDTMPPIFAASYSPVTAAGTPSQIDHVARLLAAQLTNAGVGPGVEDISASQSVIAPVVQEKPMEVSSAQSSDAVAVVDSPTVQSDLPPAAFVTRPNWQKVGTVRLAEVTKPLSSWANQSLQLILLKRLLRCDKKVLYGGAHKHRHRILMLLSAFANEQENRGMFDLIDYIYIYCSRDCNNYSKLIILILKYT